MEFNISENMRNVEITLGIQEFMLHPRIHASKCEVAITIKLAKNKIKIKIKNNSHNLRVIDVRFKKYGKEEVIS